MVTAVRHGNAVERDEVERAMTENCSDRVSRLATNASERVASIVENKIWRIDKMRGDC